MKIKLPLLLILFNTFIVLDTFSQVPLVFNSENTGASCSVTAGNLSTNRNLPDPFSFTSGGRVSTFDDWKCRRNEIKADIERYEIGPKPDRPNDITATYSGGTLTVTIRENGRNLTLTSRFTVPAGPGPHPIVIGMNSGTGNLAASLFNGIVQIPFNHDQVVTYAGGSGSRNLNDPFYTFYPNLTQNGKYSAWAWGVSRLIDGLELVASSLNLDMSRIAVTGCSYAGKMALFAGALDERITLTIAQESGGGGINSWRLSQDYTDRTGTNIEKINNTNGSWFLQSMLSRDPYSLPHDHHELIAMIAPRAFLTLGNPGFTWLGDESGYKSVMAAMEVWKAMGVEDRFGFDFTGGHDHCVAANNQNNSVTAFVNKFLRNNTSANTNIRVVPSQAGFDLNYSTRINWTTPTISFNVNQPKVTITAPAAGSAILAGQTVQIQVTVTDNDNNVSKVEFFINNTKIGEDLIAPYSIDWTPQNAGTYTISARATDAQGNTGSGIAEVKARVKRGPYSGTPHAIPGTIQLEEFDTGGQDSAYFDTTPGSQVTPTVNFRSDEDVDIENCQDTGGGYNIGWAMAGEWLEYTVDVKNSGIYRIDMRVACEGEGRTVLLTMDGQSLTSAVSVPNTSGWQNWTTVSVNNVNLKAGKQVLRLTIGDVNYVNLNYITFTAVTANEFPLVSLTAPEDNSSFTSTSITLEANASDPDGTIANVMFYVDDLLLGTDQTAPYTWTWTGMNIGEYVVTAVATDDKGAIATSVPVTIFVTGNIVVRARGTEGSEILQLISNGNVLTSWTMKTEYALYSFSGPGTGTFRLNYTNDATGRDIQVDYLEVNKTRYEAEDQSINTGYYTNGACGGGGFSEMLHCNGYIEFNLLITGTAAVTPEVAPSACPNPTTGLVKLSEVRNWELYNFLGELILQGHSDSIDLSNQPAGAYVLISENQRIKLIKK